MNELTAEKISELAADRRNIHLTLHVLNRFKERGIVFEDVQNVLLHGENTVKYSGNVFRPYGLRIAAFLYSLCLALPEQTKREGNSRSRRPLGSCISFSGNLQAAALS